MFAVSCIQAMKCPPTDARPGRHPEPGAGARRVPDKIERILQPPAAPSPAPPRSRGLDGLNGFHELQPSMLNRRIEGRTHTYAELYEWLMPGELLDDPPPGPGAFRTGSRPAPTSSLTSSAGRLRPVPFGDLKAGTPAASGRQVAPNAPITPSVAVTTRDGARCRP